MRVYLHRNGPDSAPGRRFDASPPFFCRLGEKFIQHFFGRIRRCPPSKMLLTHDFPSIADQGLDMCRFDTPARTRG
jgi:hypothetical protein